MLLPSKKITTTITSHKFKLISKLRMEMAALWLHKNYQHQLYLMSGQIQVLQKNFHQVTFQEWVRIISISIFLFLLFSQFGINCHGKRGLDINLKPTTLICLERNNEIITFSKMGRNKCYV